MSLLIFRGRRTQVVVRIVVGEEAGAEPLIMTKLLSLVKVFTGGLIGMKLSVVVVA